MRSRQVGIRGRVLLFLCGFLSLLVMEGNARQVPTPVAQAQGGGPANARGLVYDGLELPHDGTCGGALKINGSSPKHPLCTHGPDQAPPQIDVAQSTAPLSTTSDTASAVTCDGDGVSGKRVQVIYARAADVPDQYMLYLSSFRQWVTSADAVFQNSAAETGGMRQVRFVHDSNCLVIVSNVVMAAGSDDLFGYTINDLQAQGYNRTDRDYLVFVDAHVYCGISNIETDDRYGVENFNNGGQHYSRVDAGCWSGDIAGHELMHALGGVQKSAPHSSGEWHCWDQADLMCRPTNGTPTQNLCPNPGYLRFDCNHDDYYHTHPPFGSYLATHWDAAISQFLLSANLIRIDSNATSNAKSKVFTPTGIFKPTDTVVARIHVVDQYRASMAGVSVAFTIGKAGSIPQCSFASSTNALGNVEGTCQIPNPNNNVSGAWLVHATSVSLSGYPFDANESLIDQSFVVR